MFIDGEPVPERVELEGWPTLVIPAGAPPPPLPPVVVKTCKRWADAFLAMLQRNAGHLGPYLD